MKKAGIVFLAALGLLLSFFAGGYLQSRTCAQRRAEAFDHCISAAIETVEGKGLSTPGAAEFVASNLWAAHELCDRPEISAELSDLWNTLVYKKDTLNEKEDTLTAQLKRMLEQ